MRKIAITGNACSGLPKAAQVCEAIGIPVFHADLAIKYLLNWREDIHRQVRIQFGQGAMRLEGEFGEAPSPSKFNTAEKFDRLLDVAQVDLLLMWESFCRRHAHRGIAAFLSHIVFERRLEKRFDAVVNIYRPQRMRAHDVASVRGVSFSQALSMTAQEMDEYEKTRRSDHVVHNYDNLSLLTQLESVRMQQLAAVGHASSPASHI